MNDTEWYNEWQQVTRSGATSDNEWQQVAQQVTMNDSDWKRVRTSNKIWQWVMANDSECQNAWIRMRKCRREKWRSKKWGRSKRKKPNLLFLQVIPWTTSLKVTSAGKLLYFLNVDLYAQRIIYFNKGSSSRAIYKSILHAIQNVWHGQGILMDITAYDSTLFWVIY